jgi:hypothetical protein
MNYRETLRYSHSGLDLLAALRSPLDVLAGVSPGARDALSALGITTVIDLATAPLFELAARIAQAVDGEGTDPAARLSLVPGGVGAANAPSDVRSFASARLNVLRALSAEEAQRLHDQLQVETVADLGRWPGYRAAITLLQAAGIAPVVGQEEGAELKPRLGEFPTERRYYSTLVVDHVDVKNPTDLSAAGPIDISPALNANFGFSAPAVGALLTFEQSWFAHGITLGNLLHSVALAPGESTRIAIVDWSRQTRASGTEAIDETEALTNTTTHNRAVSEVQDAVATEVQSGFSETHGTSTTKSAGGGLGFSMGPVTIGGSAAGGTTTTNATSYSSSAGSRNLAATMSQQVMDATQQAASAVRGRRASIVKEISVSEQESVSTRILANYNHMHALTVQYFEVIELYRVTTRLHETGRCLFVPMKLVEFSESTIARYQTALANAALTRRARELLSIEYGMIALEPVRSVRAFINSIRSTVTASNGVRAQATAATSAATSPSTESPTPVPPPPPPPPTREDAWIADEVRLAARLTATNLVRPGSSALMLPKDSVIEGMTPAITDGGALVEGIALRLRSGGADTALARTSIGWLVPGEVRLEDVREIVLKTSAGPNPANGRLSIQLSYRGSVFPISVPISAPAGAANVVARFGDTAVGPELAEHLAGNKLHYNQAIWRSLDTSTIALLLSPFQFEGLPVADLIDPRPIQVAGNYLVFRMPGFTSHANMRAENEQGVGAEAESRQNWLGWLTKRGLSFDKAQGSEQLVPVPTGGVFAEAVLGRSNSAEKLDPTRFWNWQDSPIPLQPPEIAAIGLGSRAQPMDVTPGQLGQPVVNIVNPTNLPDPAGLGPTLAALQNGGMFRDMSGLAAAIGLAGSLSNNTTAATADAGRLAAANLAVAAQKDIESQRIAAQLLMASLGAPNASAGTPKNITEMGAMLNQAEQRDRSGAGSGATAPSGAGGATGGGAGSSGSGGGGAGGGSASAPRAGGMSSVMPSNSDMAFRRALFGPLGASGADAILANSRSADANNQSSLTINAELPQRLEWPTDNFPGPNDVANKFRELYNERIDKGVYEGVTEIFGLPIAMATATLAEVNNVRLSAISWINNSGVPKVGNDSGRKELEHGILCVALASTIDAARVMRAKLALPSAGIPTATGHRTQYSVWYNARRVGMVMAWLDRAIQSSTNIEAERIARAKEAWETKAGIVVDLLLSWAPPGMDSIIAVGINNLLGELGPNFEQQFQTYQAIMDTFRVSYKRLARVFFMLTLKADLPAHSQLDPTVLSAVNEFEAHVLGGWDAERDFLNKTT